MKPRLREEWVVFKGIFCSLASCCLSPIQFLRSWHFVGHILKIMYVIWYVGIYHSHHHMIMRSVTDASFLSIVMSPTLSSVRGIRFLGCLSMCSKSCKKYFINHLGGISPTVAVVYARHGLGGGPNMEHTGRESVVELCKSSNFDHFCSHNL